MKEIKATSVEKVIKFCEKHHLYTRGTREEYEILLSNIGFDHTVEIDDDKMIDIAIDIFNHSDEDELIERGLTHFVEIINLMIYDRAIFICYLRD